MPQISILLIDAESHYALAVATGLGRVPGTRVHAIASTPSARVRHSRYCSSFEVVPAELDEEARIEAILRIAERHRVNVMLPVCETGTRLLQRHAETLRQVAYLPPFADPDTFETAGDKWLLAEFLGSRGIPHPPTALVTDDDAFREALAGLQGPYLIKPRHGTGGLGIHGFPDRASLLAHIGRHPELTGSTIVQSVIPGRDIDASVLCRGGRLLAHSYQFASDKERSGFRPATALEMKHLPESHALTARLFAALAWDGIANIDLREDERDGSLSVLEINPRFWSSLLASDAAGVNFPFLAALTALGVAYAPPRQASQRFLQARSALEVAARALLRGRLDQIPSPHETIWPYLLSDPLPHALGRVPRPPAMPVAPAAGRGKARAA